MNHRVKIMKAIAALNKIIYAEDTTNKLANQIKVARDLMYEVLETLEALEQKSFEEFQKSQES